MRTKAHTVYKNQAGKRIPGVTTMTGLLEKRGIHYWIANVTKEGHDWEKYRDDKGNVGTLVHSMIMSELRGEKIDTSDFTKKQIDEAENSFLSWLEWRKGKEIESILIETPLVSERFQFGGTPDHLCRINGELVIQDYKTGGIYQEAIIQGCAYWYLVRENGYPAPVKLQILGIPRSEDERFEEQNWTDFSAGWKPFERLRGLYDDLKQIKI